MTINYPKIIFFNLIAAYLVIQILISKIGVLSIFDNSLFLIVLAGFVLSFFIKENLFTRYLKLAFLNSLFFGFLLGLFFVSDIFINDSDAEFTLTGLIYFSLFFGTVYFFGALAGIIPKAIIERLRKQEIGKLLDRSLQEKL